MPMFEYHCTTCGQTIEVLQKDATPRDVCGGDCVAAADPLAAQRGGWGEGKLTKKLSAHAVLSGGMSSSPASAPSMCGMCGGAPGSCEN